MKLNIKRSAFIGLAFLSICAFWQMYDNIVPLILTNIFHMDETWSGAIMACNNVLALSCCHFSAPFRTGAKTASAAGCPTSCSERAARSSL